MDLEEHELTLKLLWPNELPGYLKDNPELLDFLTNKLATYKLDELEREQSRLAEETKNIVEQTQDLAISNYKTFIQTAENTRSILEEFQKAETQVDVLSEKLPQFAERCETFLLEAAKINEERRLNSITLKKNALLVEILEIPQLMERCIREGRYDEALELASYVQKIGQNQGDIPIIKPLVSSVEALWHTMLVQLVAQLRTDLQLPKCLQIIGYLRRMQAFGNKELQLKFLQARDSWLRDSLENIPKDDAQQHLTKTIEVTRVNLFNIITQHHAIFSDDPVSAGTATTSPAPTRILQDVTCVGNSLFQAWLHRKIADFLRTLEMDLQRGTITSVDAVLGQCMYFGLSFSRVGLDFRAILISIFVRVIRTNFESAIAHVNTNFAHEMEKYTIINKIAVHTHTTPAQPEQDDLSPPETLLDFHPLAQLCNGYLNVLNDLRLCSPVALANDVTRCLQSSLEFVAAKVVAYYRQEQQSFTSNERETFTKLCSIFAYDLVPYVQRCIHAIFPQQVLASKLSQTLLTLEQEHITYLQTEQILEPLLPLLKTTKPLTTEANYGNIGN